MAQRLMWSFFVVLLHPLLGLLSDFAQLLKHKHVEHRFAVAAIEPLDETILHRLGWFDELEQHAMLLGPVSQGHGNELRSIVPAKVRLSCSADLAYGDSAQRTLNEGAAKH